MNVSLQRVVMWLVAPRFRIPWVPIGATKALKFHEFGWRPVGVLFEEGDRHAVVDRFGRVTWFKRGPNGEVLPPTVEGACEA